MKKRTHKQIRKEEDNEMEVDAGNQPMIIEVI